MNKHKKTIASVCSDVAIMFGYDTVDIGLLSLFSEMWFECKKQGVIKIDINHPIDRAYYISQAIARDCDRENGCWVRHGKIDYPGISRSRVNVYKLRSKNA